ncbi:hypothetical protein [Pseudomonas sp. Bc-h]|uniref:hypothetical protein n=1 Tax=Pseudomonas sp. Bc-h TaxID=1943632 RepID=UPI00117B569D|nr:hypothetical protein [Pseudomonas sp. Bc-h]
MKGKSGVPKWLVSIALTALVIAIILLLRFVVTFGLTPSDKQESWGQFGDFVGGILNPLFSIIGLVALLYTIKLQSEEMRNSTKELKSSAKALRKQNKHNARQQFDSNLFQLLTLSLEHANLISFGFGSGKKTGASAFNAACHDFTHGWSLNKSSGNEWIERFDDWYLTGGGKSFSAYANSVTNMIDFVVDANVSNKAKNFAYSTISANMSINMALIYFLLIVFSEDHNWYRETLVEIDFFSNCQRGGLNFDAVLDFIGDFERLPNR